MPAERVLLEIAAGSLGSALAAQDGGADRVELCANLGEGGTTPSHGTIAVARDRLRLPLYVLVRPRAGDFLYDEAERGIMLRDIEACVRLGCDGVVVGALDRDGDVDVSTCRELIAAAGPLAVTFHRAFDAAREPVAALEAIIALGCERVLTSGGQADALAGADTIAALVRQAGARLRVMAGAGVNAGNVRELVARSGVREVHASAKATRRSAMRHCNALLAGLEPDRIETDPELVCALVVARDGVRAAADRPELLSSDQYTDLAPPLRSGPAATSPQGHRNAMTTPPVPSAAPTALVNARVLLPQGFADDVAVLVAGARIVAVVAQDDPRLATAAVHDLRGRILAPGFIDCQVNGGGGVLFNDAPDVESIRRIGEAHRRFGTTGFLPTLISDRPEVMRAAIAAVDAAIAAGVPGVLGIHLEGPYLAPTRRGIHDADHFTAPDAEAVALVSSLQRGRTLLTVAPERMAPGVLRALIDHGVIVAIGHTAADHGQVRAALALGVRGFTHLYNAMTPLQGREPGVVGAALEDRDSWCGVIVDGQHVHPASLRIALAAKPRGKVFLVTDAMPPVGSTNTGFVLNGHAIDCRDGRCTDAAGTLAGSCLDMAGAVRNSVSTLGIELAEALRMASTWPAEFLGIAGERGTIAPGMAADLVELDQELAVQGSWIGGARVPA